MEIDIKEFNKMMLHYFGMTVSPEVIFEALKMGKQISFQKGDIILGMGEKMNKVYFVVEGIARSYYIDSDGNDITKSFVLEYNFCVAESFFTDEPSSQIFEAIEDMTVIEFDSRELKSYMLSDTALKEIYIKMMELTIIYKMKRESSFQLESATERYINFKKELPNIENRVKQSYVASYLGITPVSLSRIRRALREDFE